MSPRTPEDAYRICGRTVIVESADSRLRRLVRTHWGSFAIARRSSHGESAVFRFHDRGAAALPRLNTQRVFRTENLLVLTDARRYLLTGSLYARPWEFDCRSLPGWDPEYVYYYVLEPLLLDVLKRLDVLVWHSAAVERRGAAVLLAGRSGSGKSTTTLRLLELGCSFLADDVSLLGRHGRRLQVSGKERDLFLTQESLRLLPEWRRFGSGRRLKKGHQWKHRIDLSTKRSRRRTPAVVTSLLFPRVTRSRKTELEKLSVNDALIACLAQAPKEYPAAILGPSALEKQFEMYTLLAESAAAYRLHLGSDQDSVRAVLSTIPGVG